MGHMEGSTEILAARALAGNIEDLCTVAIFAIGNTTAIIVGREIGAGRREHVYEVGATLDTLAFLCGLIIGIPLILGAWFVFPWLVYPFFHLSETAGSITTMMLTFIGVFLALRARNLPVLLKSATKWNLAGFPWKTCLMRTCGKRIKRGFP